MAKYTNGKPLKTVNKRLNVSTPTEYEKDGKPTTFWTSVGSAFEGQKGITVILNALPVSGKLFISEPQETAANE